MSFFFFFCRFARKSKHWISFNDPFSSNHNIITAKVIIIFKPFPIMHAQIVFPEALLWIAEEAAALGLEHLIIIIKFFINLGVRHALHSSYVVRDDCLLFIILSFVCVNKILQHWRHAWLGRYQPFPIRYIRTKYFVLGEISMSKIHCCCCCCRCCCFCRCHCGLGWVSMSLSLWCCWLWVGLGWVAIRWRANDVLGVFSQKNSQISQRLYELQNIIYCLLITKFRSRHRHKYSTNHRREYSHNDRDTHNHAGNNERSLFCFFIDTLTTI